MHSTPRLAQFCILPWCRFLKTHKVGGSMFGRALKRAQKMHVDRMCSGAEAPAP